MGLYIKGLAHAPIFIINLWWRLFLNPQFYLLTLVCISGNFDDGSNTNASITKCLSGYSQNELLALVPQRKGGKQQQSSLIWDHAIQQGPKLDVDRDGDPIWLCRHCKQIYKVKSTTKKATEHLCKDHQVTTTESHCENENDQCNEIIGYQCSKPLSKAALY